jgi:arabinogalactan oligomer/maltooligosaccharide transport system permease protein
MATRGGIGQRILLARVNGENLWFRILVNVILIIACAAAVYPALRILTVSLRPGDRLLSTSLALIPPDATLDNYRSVIFEKGFLLWLWNSVLITISTAFTGLIIAATPSSCSCSPRR